MDQIVRGAPAITPGPSQDGTTGSSTRRMWLCAFGLLAAAVFGWGAQAIVQDHQRAAAAGVEVEGRMTGGYRETTNRRGGRVTSVSYYPTFRYQQADGKVTFGTAADAVEMEAIQAGRAMPIRVVPGNPSVLRLATALDAGPSPAPRIMGGLALTLGIASVFGLRRKRSAGLPAGVVGFVALLWGTAAQAQAPTALPEAIAAPPWLSVVATIHAEGAQIYECRVDMAGRLAWHFQEPVATLMEGGRTVGRHYVGPSWELDDGSVVAARAVAGRSPGSGAGDIPWLRLEVGQRRDAGRLAPVTDIQRINTVGGVAEGACLTAGAFRSVPYSADYVFLAPVAN